jgi:hypothetical protein
VLILPVRGWAGFSLGRKSRSPGRRPDRLLLREQWRNTGQLWIQKALALLTPTTKPKFLSLGKLWFGYNRLKAQPVPCSAQVGLGVTWTDCLWTAQRGLSNWVFPPVMPHYYTALWEHRITSSNFCCQKHLNEWQTFFELRVYALSHSTSPFLWWVFLR